MVYRGFRFQGVPEQTQTQTLEPRGAAKKTEQSLWLAVSGAEVLSESSVVFRYSYLNVVHYPHLLSTQISASECCPYRKLRLRQPPRLINRQKHPALNGEQKTSTTSPFNTYNPTILQ